MSVLKAKGVVERDGDVLTWDNTLEALISISDSHPKEFLDVIHQIKKNVRAPKNLDKKVPETIVETIEDAKREINNGKTISSEVLEKIKKAGRFKE